MARAQRIKASGVRPLELPAGLAAPLRGRAWAAEVVRLAAPRATIELAVLEPHEYRSTAGSTARPAMLLVGVGSGRLRGTAGGCPFEVLPGQALFVDARLSIHSEVDERVQLVRVLSDTVWGPGPAAVSDGGLNPVLADSPVLRSCLSAASALVRHAQGSAVGADDDAIASLMAGVQQALLVEASHECHRGDESAARAARRQHIERYIDAHLDDQELSPPTISRALGISVRTVHSAFAGTETTVAAFIRRRRVDAVDRAILTPGWRPSEVAAAFGFRSADQMARAFRASFGRSIREGSRGAADAG